MPDTHKFRPGVRAPALAAVANDTADPAMASGTVYTDTIAEVTSAAGVTIDGVLLKDGVNRGTLYTSNKFISTEQTGTGASQDIAHGLGATPTMVWWAVSDAAAGLTAGPPPVLVMTPGAHDATNIKMTVSTGVKFYVFALK